VTQAANGAADHGKQIVVLDRGFVYVGDVKTDADWCTITDASCVRRWGTKKGLGELARSGPLDNTVLDPAGTVRAPMRAVIAMLACEAAKWPTP
jgi:hypothetical protein